MSTAAPVPETWQLSGDDAVATLRRVGRRRLLVAAFQRMRVADGFSHARSLAFMASLLVIQAVIALVGLASVWGGGAVSDVIVRGVQAAAPGPAGRVLTDAVDQARNAGAAHDLLALGLGLAGSLVSGTTLMGQLERGLNRLYGVERDRSSVRKYTRAFLLAVSAGGLASGAVATVAFGRSIGEAWSNGVVDRVWGVARWPLALVLMMAAVALLFEACPRRRQPAWSWLAFGSTVSVGLWFAVTVGLAASFRLSHTFGDTYGPLAGLVALLLWAMLSSISLLFGAAVAAQLEAERAGAPEPQDPTKVEVGEVDRVGATTATVTL